jgi:hypothetical protein
MNIAGLAQMNNETRELFRTALLRILDANNTQFGLGVTALGHLVGAYGFTATADEIKVEIQYLQDKQFVATQDKPISPENRRWRITAEGRDFVAAN